MALVDALPGVTVAGSRRCYVAPLQATLRIGSMAWARFCCWRGRWRPTRAHLRWAWQPYTATVGSANFLPGGPA